MKYTSFIWDFDGTLFDSYPHIAAAFEKVMTRDAIPFEHEEVLRALYVSFGECRKRFGLTTEQYADVIALEHSHSFRPCSAPFHGTAAVLRAICEAGGRNFLYTHRDRQAWTYLRLWGLDKYFTGGVDSSMHFPSKPAPDAVHHICRVYSIAPETAVMVGDREIDVLSGVRAGCAGCLFCSHPVEDADAATCAAHTVNSMSELAGTLEIPLSDGDMLSADNAAVIREQAAQAAAELCEAAKLCEGSLVVVGCSSSEITGERIGSSSSPEAAEAVLAGLKSVFNPRGIHIAAQCCEHLNRALIMDKKLAEACGYEIMNVVPMPKAGGAFATLAWQQFENPATVAEIKADAGLDIGGTLIGMHLKRVAVPLRLSVKSIGEAPLSAARVRPPFAGGERAVYDDMLL
ncbi:MAG: TIGR01440 family protein [Clostridia bacterium]|nr:TIGR01440 family protein [Clostridia bacterium]